MDEARRRAEAVADEVVRWRSRQHIIEILLVYAADAVAEAVKQRDKAIPPEWMTTATREELAAALIHQCEANNRNWTYREQQAEEIAQMKTDLAGAEATNALLDEELARLRARIDEINQAVQDTVAQAVRAERERWDRATAPLVCVTNHFGGHSLGCACPCEVCRGREALRRETPR